MISTRCMIPTASQYGHFPPMIFSPPPMISWLCLFLDDAYYYYYNYINRDVGLPLSSPSCHLSGSPTSRASGPAVIYETGVSRGSASLHVCAVSCCIKKHVRQIKIKQKQSKIPNSPIKLQKQTKPHNSSPPTLLLLLQ